MRKKCIPVLYLVLINLFLYSCSEFVLPKRVHVEGTLDLPIKAGSSDWGKALAGILAGILGEDGGDELGIDYSIKVYDAYGPGQTEQMFCIYIHSEMTNPLNPDDYLDNVADFLYKEASDEEFEIAYENIDISALGEETELFSVNIPSLPAGVSVSVELNVPPINLDLGDGFLHAEIAEGSITIELQSDDPGFNGNAISITPDIRITQQNSSAYLGMSQNLRGLSGSLAGQHMNDEPLVISGSLSLISNTAVNAMSAKLVMKMQIQKLKLVHWNFDDNMKDQLNHQIDAISFGGVEQYINFVQYDKYDEANPNETGIGIVFHFDDVVDGLEMSLDCDDLNISHAFQNLEKGKNIVYANQGNVTLWLNGGENWDPNYPAFSDSPVRALYFGLTLRPKGGGNVLRMEPEEGITPGVLGIKGEAKFFQNWAKAQINMNSIIHAAGDGDDLFSGQIPDGTDPIDLSQLNKYISGFTFEGIDAKLYLSGPDGVFQTDEERPTMSFYAEDTETGISVDMYPAGHLILDKNDVQLNNYLDTSETYYTQRTLPQGGSPFEFLEVMNERPAQLVFNYVIGMPDALTVTPDMFEEDLSGEISSSNIVVTIMILLPLKLTGPGEIKFPGMFGDDPSDLFGRTSVEETSLFTRMDVNYLGFTVEFADSFFNGGKLFIEKDPVLFPDGIQLDNKKIQMKVDNYAVIKENLIIPDFKVDFGEGAGINIPRNMGLTSIRFEAKGIVLEL